MKRSVKVGFGWKKKEHANLKQRELCNVMGSIQLKANSQLATALPTQSMSETAKAYEVRKAETFALLRRQLTFQ